MPRLLLDTHALIWFGQGHSRLSDQAKAALEDSSVEAFVSAASAWEIATKYRIGKLPEVAAMVADIAIKIQQLGFLPLSVTVEHAQRAGELPGHHRDPFDRMLAAQALIEDLTLVSNETILDQFGVRRLW